MEPLQSKVVGVGIYTVPEASTLAKVPRSTVGRPIVKDFGVPTIALARAFKKESSYSIVADWFEVDEQSVKDAVEFETSWLRAA